MLDVIIKYTTVELSVIACAIAMASVILVCNCFLGKKYHTGLLTKIILFCWVVFGIGLSLLNGIVYGMFSAIAVFFAPELESLLASDGYFAALAVTTLQYLEIFLIFVIVINEKKFLKRMFVAFLLTIFMTMLVHYGTTVFSSIFHVMFGTNEFNYRMYYGLGISSLITYTLDVLCFQLPAFLFLYFGIYRKGIRMKLSPWIVAGFVFWMFVFAELTDLPFISEVSVYSQVIINGYIVAMLTLFSVAVPIMIVYLIYSVRLREKITSQNTYLKAELDYIEQYKRKEQETRAFRHDMINQLALLDMNLAAGKREDCLEHLEELLGKARGFSPRFNTGDEMLDCIVSMKNEKMEENGISFTCDGVCDGGLDLKPMDLCVIFANAMDNAIEATLAERAKGTDVPMAIDFKITRTGSYFVFKLKNPCPEDLDAESLFDPNVIYTSKKDKRHHGFGTKNLLRTVNRYDGMVKAKREGREFELGITLPRNA